MRKMIKKIVCVGCVSCILVIKRNKKRDCVGVCVVFYLFNFDVLFKKKNIK